MEVNLGRWEFVRSANGHQWQWRHVASDGAVQKISVSFDGFGKAITNAIRNGFHPAREHWVIVDERWCTHFEPGGNPVTIPRKQDTSISIKRRAAGGSET